jgi:hypothetical protein
MGYPRPIWVKRHHHPTRLAAAKQLDDGIADTVAGSENRAGQRPLRNASDKVQTVSRNGGRTGLYP